MTDFEVLRRQVAIGGTLAGVPRPGTRRVVEVRGGSAGSVVASVATREDGTFFFLDLPDGKYAVALSGAGAGAAQDVVVKRNAAGDVTVAWVVLGSEG